MGWTSTLPAAIDGLVRVFTEAPGLDGVTVRDGASVSQARITEVISVGYTGAEDERDAEAVLAREGLGGIRDRETLTIRCVAAVLLGTTDLPAARRRAYELLAAAASALAADRTLGGAVMTAWISAHSLSQSQIDQGAQAVILFTVTCDAYSGL
ncbi:hypothetical protein ACFZC3_15500 [Streptomyces sp. NPDC007903]|uniref:hypothetical protein n=1 Tax=Streptomyces sp. NPDC007903 TaxID=3364786 RepID=UPI0036EDC9AB